MSQENYYIITSTPDGIYCYVMTKEELEEDLKKEPGDGYIEQNFISFKNFCGTDLNEVPDGTVIIKGEEIIPKPIKVVKEWEV